MMDTYFVLVDLKPSEEHEAFLELSRIPEIKEVWPLFGEYDVLLKIEADTKEEAKKIITGKVLKVKGILDIKTLTGM